MQITPARYNIHLAFDNKDAVNARFAARWDRITKRRCADDSHCAAALYRCADLLAGQRDYAAREAEAAERAAKHVTRADADSAVRTALKTTEAPRTLVQAQRAIQQLRVLPKQMSLLVGEEREMRTALPPFEGRLNAETSTRNKSFRADQAAEVFTAAQRVLSGVTAA